jgi:cytochrome c556
MKTLTTLAIIALTTSCSRKQDSSDREAEIESAKKTARVQVPADAAVPGDAAIKQHMLEHFAAVSELQRAIARGHLDDAKKHARWLLEHDETLLAGWQPFVDEMRAAAAAVNQARDLPGAGVLAARLGRACSRCHQERSAVVAFAWEPAPDDGPTLQLQMKRHQWAAARLWEGLVGPSNEMWTQGSEVLATAKLDVLAATGGSARGDVAALASKVNELARRAGTTTDVDARSKLYGELLSTCAGCHQLVRPTAVVGP